MSPPSSPATPCRVTGQHAISASRAAPQWPWAFLCHIPHRILADPESGLGNYEAIFNPSRVNPALSRGVWHGGSGLTGSGTLKGPHGLGKVMACLWVLVSPPTTWVGWALQSWGGSYCADTFYEADGEFATRWRALKLSSRSLYLILCSCLGGKPDLLGLDLLRDTLSDLGRFCEPPSPLHTALPTRNKPQPCGGMAQRPPGSQTHSHGSGDVYTVGSTHRASLKGQVQGQILEGCWQLTCLQNDPARQTVRPFDR